MSSGNSFVLFSGGFLWNEKQRIVNACIILYRNIEAKEVVGTLDEGVTTECILPLGHSVLLP